MAEYYTQLMADLEKMRARRPLILNLTNFVVSNSTANALLALGASPAMSYHDADMRDLTPAAGAVVVNIGTPVREFWESMFVAGHIAREHGIPVVLDPVAAGAVHKRTEMCRRFLQACRPQVVRGNASEIKALGSGEADMGTGTAKGADAMCAVEDALHSARQLARRQQCVVSVSGAVDCITDGSVMIAVGGGHSMMTLVTGLGCTASAPTGAFLSVAESPLTAAVEAMMVMSTAGGIAAAKASGPGTLQLHFYDALYNLTEADLRAQVEVMQC